MKNIQKGIKEYISMRQALGFELEHAERRLFDFFSFMQEKGVSYITKEIAVQWAKKPKNAHSSWWAKRLGIVRGFAKYWSAIDNRTEIIPVDLLPAKYERRIPYIYTKEEIDKLLRADAKIISHS
jgi:site-specific recombinase XerD